MRKPTYIFASACIVVLIGSLIFYFNYINSPKYSLIRIKTAIEERDWNSFQKYVDIESSFNDLISSATSGNQTANSVAKLFTGKLSEIVKSEVQKSIENGNLKDTNNEVTKGLWKNTGDGFKGVRYEKVDGKVAIVGLEFYQPKLDTSFVLDVKMRKTDNGWQIFGLANFTEYTASVDSKRFRKLKELNKPIKDQIIKIINYESLIFSYEFNGKDIFKCVSILKNTSRKSISKYDSDIEFKKSDNKLYKRIITTYEFNPVLQPGETREFQVKYVLNRYVENDNYLIQTIFDKKLNYSIVDKLIIFDDGEEIKILTTLD